MSTQRAPATVTAGLSVHAPRYQRLTTSPALASTSSRCAGCSVLRVKKAVTSSGAASGLGQISNVSLAVPLPPLLAAWACLAAARRTAEGDAFALVREQVMADLAMLRQAGAA